MLGRAVEKFKSFCKAVRSCRANNQIGNAAIRE
jgi:hypothetical protein